MGQAVKRRAPAALRMGGATALCLLLALGLYLGGEALGGRLISMQRSYRIELFNRMLERQGVVARVLSDEETHQVATRYLGALADAVVRLELFPRKDDAQVFLDIVSALPPKVDIERFTFSGRNLVISCAAGDAAALRQFAGALEEAGSFRDVSLELYQKQDGAYMGTLTCIAP